MRVVMDLSTGVASVVDAGGRSVEAWSGYARRVVEKRVEQGREIGVAWVFALGSRWMLTSPPDGFWREINSRS